MARANDAAGETRRPHGTAAIGIPTRLTWLFGALTLLLAALPAHARPLGRAGTGEVGPAKIHARAMAVHRDDRPPRARPKRRRRPKGPERLLTHKVYGYYPYWGTDWEGLCFDLLSTLAYFASEISEHGVITHSHGWGGTSVGAMVETAQAAGVRVVQTITLFDNAAIGRLLASAERRNTAITNIIAEIQRGGGEGVNIDFEFVPVAQKAAFVTFMKDLTERMHAAIPGSEVTLATPSVDWGGAYDYDQLAIHTDGLMIMAYGYHWTGGPPGPLSPLVGEAPWSGRSLTWTVDDYIRFGGEENRHKFILGLPFYGNDWPTVDDSAPGTARARGRAIFYKKAVLGAAEHGRRWDDVTKTPWYAYQDSGGWRQVWYDDDKSLGHKLDLITRRGLGGLGIWALSYDGDRPELFDVIEAKLSEPAGPPPPPPFPTDGTINLPEQAGSLGGWLQPPPPVNPPDPGDPGSVNPPPTGGCSSTGGAGNLAVIALILALTFLVARFGGF